MNGPATGQPEGGTPSAGAPGGLPPDSAPTGALAQALGEALAAEHAAIYAYGPVGVRLDEKLADAAREAEETHRDRRDALVVSLARRQLPAPAPHAAYELPFPVRDAGDALRLAVLVEERVAAVWRAVLARAPARDVSASPSGAGSPPAGRVAGTAPPAGASTGPPVRREAGTDREVALAALVDAALRATRWRVAAGIEPATVPFPGEP